MAYCTQDDLIKSISEETLIQLTDDDNSGAIDEAVVTDAIDKASTEMDSYLSVRYSQLPLASVPQLADANAELAIYRLFKRRQVGDTDDIKQRHQDTIKWLEKVRDRKANIVGINDQTGTPDQDGKIIHTTGKSSNFDWSGY